MTLNLIHFKNFIIPMGSIPWESKLTMKLHIFLFAVLLALLIINIGHAENEQDWMPDPNLRGVVREKLQAQNNKALTIVDMQRLYDLVSINDGIESLQGLERATNLEFLHVAPSRVSDLTPLATLPNLRVLKLYENELSDISPLAKLASLEVLHLENNQIIDISPLENLKNLRELQLHGNLIENFSPLAELVNLERLRIDGNLSADISMIPTSNLTKFVYDEFCDLERLPIEDRVTGREYPSIFSAWHNIINQPSLSEDERLVHHDLHWHGFPFGFYWRTFPDGTMKMSKNLSGVEQRDAMLSKNPNMIFLASIQHYAAPLDWYPKDWPYWVKDDSDDYIEDTGWRAFLIDFTQPGAQDHFVQQVIEIANCGVFDGIFLDWWSEEWNSISDPKTGKVYYDLEVELEAKVSMLRRIREAVGDDFLIIVNTHRHKIPRSAPYVNGTFMETFRDTETGYTHKGLREIEDTLLWAEQNLREPQINSLEGWSIETEPLDSENNQRQMRLFTTLSLTHSDGYTSYVAAIFPFTHKHTYEIWEGHSDEHARGEAHEHLHEHYWYDFYDANLGTPVGRKGQLYQLSKGVSIEGLFIREFTNGWAVYNRSGKTQQIQLIESATGVESGITSVSHILPDLDGEIYLKKVSSPTDVNGDGIVNILDLVAIANAFGKAEPDVNGDGTVNVLDLVAVANAFE